MVDLLNQIRMSQKYLKAITKLILEPNYSFENCHTKQLDIRQLFNVFSKYISSETLNTLEKGVGEKKKKTVLNLKTLT